VVAWIVHGTERAAINADGVLDTIKEHRGALDAKMGPEACVVNVNVGENQGAYWVAINADQELEPSMVVKDRFIRKEKPRGARSIASALAIVFAVENIYRAGEAKPPSPMDYERAGRRLQGALDKGRLKRRVKDRRFDKEDVKRIWEGKGPGNARKYSLPTVDVEKFARGIVEGSSEGKQTRTRLLYNAGLDGYANKRKQKALASGAVTRAESAVGTGALNGLHALVTPATETKELSTKESEMRKRRVEVAKQKTMRTRAKPTTLQIK
jgi:hypothetical protein